MPAVPCVAALIIVRVLKKPMHAQHEHRVTVPAVLCVPTLITDKIVREANTHIVPLCRTCCVCQPS